MGQQVHHQHQHRDELLAGALDQPRRDDGAVDRDGVGSVGDRRADGARDVRRRRMGGASQHRSVARHGPIDGPQWGMWPTGGAWLTLPLWDRYEYTGDRALSAAHLPVAERRGAVLPRHARRGADAPLARHLAVAVARERAPVRHVAGVGPTMDQAILRELFGNAIKAARTLGTDADLQAKWSATRARLAPLQIGSAGQLQEWLDDWDMQAPEIHHRHVSHLFGLFPGHDIDVRRTPELAAAVETLARDSRRSGDGLGDCLADQPLGEAGRRQPRVRHPEVPARPRAHLPEHVRRAPAVSNRRQLRRRVRHRRDAAAV